MNRVPPPRPRTIQTHYDADGFYLDLKNGRHSFTRRVPPDAVRENCMLALALEGAGEARSVMVLFGSFHVEGLPNRRSAVRSSSPPPWASFRRKKPSGAPKLDHFSWQCLRHSFASRLVTAGVDIRTIQELLGYKTISMTVRYSHLAPRHQLAAVERLDAPTASSSDTTTDTGASEQETLEFANAG